MRLPEAYPHQPERVGFQQTQMSLLFFAGDYVYKVKKPVNLGYLDYSTLQDRHRLCLREVELNRRLCPDVYLGVVPIVRKDKQLLVEHEGEPVEYAVKMRRLPQERMLDCLLGTDAVGPKEMDAVARKVARFHSAGAPSAEIASYGEIAGIRRNTDENFEQTLPYIGDTITGENHSLIQRFTDELLDNHRSLFEQRARDGRIRDCHGDLHAAHVCLTDDICIYDCIEFNDRFRYGDVASEVAFLAMDLDRYGRNDLSTRFVDSYVQASGDAGTATLMPFYKCYRAYVRGKVEGFKLGDPLISKCDKEAARWLARKYFLLARRYIEGRGLLILISGLTGSGKSTVASGLKELLAAPVFSSDVVRKELAGLPQEEHSYVPFAQGIYSPEWTERTHEEMRRRATEVLTRGGCAILDASFLRARERRKAVEAAMAVSARTILVECNAPYDVMAERLRRRQEGPTVSDGRPEILDGQTAVREPVADAEADCVVSVDTTQPSNDMLEVIWRLL